MSALAGDLSRGDRVGPARPRVCFVSTGLATGGAETMLLKLLAELSEARIEASVISLRDKGVIGGRIEALGVPVEVLGLGHGRSLISAVWRLRRCLRRLRPNVVQGWMYHGNLAASLATMLAGGRWPVLWSIRQSLYDLAKEKRGTSAMIRLGARLSRTAPRTIVYNSRVAAAQHEAIGYSPRRRMVIPNGFDTQRFVPDPAARLALRAELGIPPDSIVVGMAARYHPMKNHAGLLRAAGVLRREGRDFHVVLMGAGVEASSAVLAQNIRGNQLDGRVHLLGEREDVPALTAGFDIACLSSSWGEGFPNAVGEAMACGLPLVVTDVGDSAFLVGDTGRVVPRDDPAALATAIAELLDGGLPLRTALGERARQRIVAEFSMDSIAARYAALYRDASATSPDGPAHG